ncbi:hypothetical protein GW17_00050595, partial [Ensete ventricosum]
ARTHTLKGRPSSLVKVRRKQSAKTFEHLQGIKQLDQLVKETRRPLGVVVFFFSGKLAKPLMKGSTGDRKYDATPHGEA